MKIHLKINLVYPRLNSKEGMSCQSSQKQYESREEIWLILLCGQCSWKYSLEKQECSFERWHLYSNIQFYIIQFQVAAVMAPEAN